MLLFLLAGPMTSWVIGRLVAPAFCGSSPPIPDRAIVS